MPIAPNTIWTKQMIVLALIRYVFFFNFFLLFCYLNFRTQKIPHKILNSIVQWFSAVRCRCLSKFGLRDEFVAFIFISSLCLSIFSFVCRYKFVVVFVVVVVWGAYVLIHILVSVLCACMYCACVRTCFYTNCMYLCAFLYHIMSFIIRETNKFGYS